MDLSNKKAAWAERLTWGHIDPLFIREWIGIAQDEDLKGRGLKKLPTNLLDVTTRALQVNDRGLAELITREDIVVCGLPMLSYWVEAYGEDIQIKECLQDGQHVKAGSILASIEGPSSAILAMERPLLNTLQHLSGIATHVAKYVKAMGNSKTKLLDTRKTTPLWRVFEKYAVGCGGAYNHRMGLFDRLLIKDNHLAALESSAGVRLSAAVKKARKSFPHLLLEVEVDNLEQLEAAIEAGPDVILLDNFTSEHLVMAIEQTRGRVLLEASGGISLEHLPSLAGLGLDFISIGALTHQSRWVDIGLDWL